MATPESKIFMKFVIFIFVFIISFTLINKRSVELFGLSLFFTVNILFCLIIGKDFTDGSITAEGKDMEWKLRYCIIIISMAFSLASTVIMVLTIITLHGKFQDAKATLDWSPDNREKLEDAKKIFITITTFIGVTALYVYYDTAEDVRKFVYNLIDGLLNGISEDGIFFTIFGSSLGDWIRVLFPIVLIGLGSALYGRLQMPPLEVNKFPTRVVCDPMNDAEIKPFKDAFIKSYWFLFAFLIVILLRPFVEANFDLGGISPSRMLGFFPGDRALVFAPNPSISLISLLTLGISNFTGLNDRLEAFLRGPAAVNRNATMVERIISFSIAGALVAGILIAVFMQFKIVIHKVIAAITMIIIAFIVLFFVSRSNLFGPVTFNIIMARILLMTVLRWDVIYLLAKYAFGITAMVYAGFSFKHFRDIPNENSCFFRDAHIRQLYIAFFTFLIIYYVFNTFTASAMTSIITVAMRFLVPPALLGMTSYLVFITNYFMKMAPNLVIQ